MLPGTSMHIRMMYDLHWQISLICIEVPTRYKDSENRDGDRDTVAVTVTRHNRA